jgi:Chlorophyll A-B binding protein
MQTKELKNGRLAMTAIGGMLFQNLATGQGLIEQLSGNNYL